MPFLGTDGRHFLQYSLRPVEDRIVDEFAVELDRSTARGFRLGERRDDPLGEGGTPQVVLGSVLDYFTSALLAYGVAAALYHRERSGRGQYLSLSLLRSALTIQAGRFVWAENEDRDVVRDSGAGGLTGIHPTKEGWLAPPGRIPARWRAWR
jgi:crotonobetainyl-CoA:carnitine CoA-transferase CaiB-like acyl-CoA transferase